MIDTNKKLVYQSASLPEASFIRIMLAHEDIESVTDNERLAALLGDVPNADASVKVYVDTADFSKACDIIKRHARKVGSGEVPTSIKCAACAAVNPSTFESCWQCEKSLEGATPCANDE